MKNNGLCYLWVPSFLTLSALSAEAAAAINAVHTALGLPGTSFEAGQQNPYIMVLNDLDMGGAPFTRGIGAGLASCGPIENTSFLTVQYIGLIVAFGGEVEAYRVWFEVADLDAEIPGDNPRFDKTIEGETVRLTWRELGDWPSTPAANGKWYRGSEMPAELNGNRDHGQPLPATEWLGLMQVGVSILTQAEKDAAVPPVVIP